MDIPQQLLQIIINVNPPVLIVVVVLLLYAMEEVQADGGALLIR